MAAVTYAATGKRKTSVARVIITPGVGRVLINGRELEDFFGRRVLQTIALMPFEATHTKGKFDVKVNVYGGGGTAHLDGELRREQVAGHATDAVCAKELAYGAPPPGSAAGLCYAPAWHATTRSRPAEILGRASAWRTAGACGPS